MTERRVRKVKIEGRHRVWREKSNGSEWREWKEGRQEREEREREKLSKLREMA
jgi:hypothetical protein